VFSQGSRHSAYDVGGWPLVCLVGRQGPPLLTCEEEIGMKATSVSLAIVCIVIAASLAPGRASAEWPPSGRVLTTAIKDQERPQTATDGAGGAIVVWQDNRDPRVNVFARRVRASGDLDPAWPVDGLAVLADSTTLQATAFEGQQFPVIVSDGTGGAIIAWEDRRSVDSGSDVFAQHVLASGVVDRAWPTNGLAVCSIRGDQELPSIASDGAGGAIVTWMDGRSGFTSTDIFAQHVLVTGTVDPHWPINGVALCTAPSAQIGPAIVADGSGGAIVTWTDLRPSPTGLDVYAQHVKSSGLVDSAWPVNGLALSRAADAQQNPSIVSDGQHGAIVAWEDFRNSSRSHIFAQRVLGSGTIASGWPADGLAVCTAPQEQVGARIASDGANGAIVTWLNDPDNLHHNPFVHHLLASGVVDPAWPVNGRALSQSPGDAESASIIPDGAGGAMVAWNEKDSGVFASHVEASGLLDPTFPVNGRPVRPVRTAQQSPSLVASDAGAGIVAWSDAAPGLDFDIYAMVVITQETLAVGPGAPPSGIAFTSPSPNPARGPLTLRFALPRAAAVRLAIYDAGGRRVRELMSGSEPAGTHDVVWDLRDERGQPVPAGVRFARLEVEGQTLTGKVVTVR